MAIVDYLDAISTEADLDQPSVGVVRFLISSAKATCGRPTSRSPSSRSSFASTVKYSSRS